MTRSGNQVRGVDPEYVSLTGRQARPPTLLLSAGQWAWEDLNLRPPYQVSRAQRRADRRFPRSLASVGAKGCVLSHLVLSGAGKPGCATTLSGRTQMPL